jgi:hypothetical protein
MEKGKDAVVGVIQCDSSEHQPTGADRMYREVARPCASSQCVAWRYRERFVAWQPVTFVGTTAGKKIGPGPGAATRKQVKREGVRRAHAVKRGGAS